MALGSLHMKLVGMSTPFLDNADISASTVSVKSEEVLDQANPAPTPGRVCDASGSNELGSSDSFDVAPGHRVKSWEVRALSQMALTLSLKTARSPAATVGRELK
jgi:hypothetical protein